MWHRKNIFFIFTIYDYWIHHLSALLLIPCASYILILTDATLPGETLYVLPIVFWRFTSFLHFTLISDFLFFAFILPLGPKIDPSKQASSRGPRPSSSRRLILSPPTILYAKGSKMDNGSLTAGSNLYLD